MNNKKEKKAVLSMTGYGAAHGTIGNRQWVVELRSVNSRFLDLSLKIPDELRSFESKIRKLLSAHFSRGKLECRLSYQWLPDQTTLTAISDPMLQELKKLQSVILQAIPEATPLSVAEIIRWPGVANNQDLLQGSEEACVAAIEGAMAQLQSVLNQEGEQLKKVLLQYCDQLDEVVKKLIPLSPEAVGHFRRKLHERLQEVDIAVDEERLIREVFIYAQRTSVEEELARLRIHLEEFVKTLQEGGGIGKRLDFLCQELNREANTLASKSANLSINNLAIELKLLIEQMREQVQNIA